MSINASSPPDSAEDRGPPDGALQGPARSEPMESPEAGGETDAPENGDTAADYGTTDDVGHGKEHPRGTLFLMLLFLMLIIAFWGFVYLVMIARS